MPKKKPALVRRKTRRIQVTARARHSLFQVLGAPVFSEGLTIDVSKKGIAFVSDRSYKKGSLVLLDVDFEEGGDSIRFLLGVAWVKKKSNLFQVGGELVAIDREHRERLKEQIDRMLKVQKRRT